MIRHLILHIIDPGKYPLFFLEEIPTFSARRMSYQQCPTVRVSRTAQTLESRHFETNKSHTGESHFNEARFHRSQALSKDDSDKKSSSKSQSLPEGQSTEMTFKNQPLLLPDLPTEIIIEIGSHLSGSSQACFVLTCRRLFYLWDYLVNNAALRFPYSDGLDKLDISIRTALLLKLESERWRYCAACIKLHPLADFHPTSLAYENPTRRYCKWPGIIVFCPCLRLRPKIFVQSAYQDIPIWHQCQYSDPSEGLSYRLRISLSTKRYGPSTFNFQYLIDFDPTYVHQAHRRIMLCPHTDALEQIKLGIARVDSRWTESMKLTKLIESLGCSVCHVYTDVTITNHAKTYDIKFTREFYFFGKMWKIPPFRSDDLPDYNWRRYSISWDPLALSIINKILGLSGPFSRPTRSVEPY